MRVLSTVNQCFNLWKVKTPLRMFSKIANNEGDKLKVYEDWEYCKMITNELKNNNVHQALSLLFQSYFNNKILDIQIYSHLYEKIQAQSLPLSYAQILYEVYRDHFPPHHLILKWMHKLTASNSDRIIGKLKQDFQILGNPYPSRSVRRARSARKEAKRHQKNQKQEDPIIIQANENQKNDQHYPSYPNFSNFQGSQLNQFNNPSKLIFNFQQKVSPEELFHHKLSAQLKFILLQLNINLSRNTTVDLKGVQLELMKIEAQEEQKQLAQDEEYQLEDKINEQLKHLYGCDIKKIKIKKMEFQNNKYKSQ